MKTEDKPHYYHFSFMDNYWLMSVPSQAKSWDKVTIIYENDWPDYTQTNQTVAGENTNADKT